MCFRLGYWIFIDAMNYIRVFYFYKVLFYSLSKYSSLPACMQAGKLLYGYLKRYFIFQRRLLCLCSQQFHDCSLEIVVQVHSLKLGNLLQNRGVLAYHFIDCCFQIKLDLCTFQNFKNMALGLISVQAGLLRQADLDLVLCCDGRKLNNEFSLLCQIAIRKITRNTINRYLHRCIFRKLQSIPLNGIGTFLRDQLFSSSDC